MTPEFRKHIQNARKRLDMGHFGQCAQCGRRISEERLIARPDALFCYACMRQRERRNARRSPQAVTAELS